MLPFGYGNRVKISAAFTNIAGAAVDPATVKCAVEAPVSGQLNYTYGVDAEVVKSAVGNYYVERDLDEVGIWNYRWEGLGSHLSADEGFFHVRQPKLTIP